MKGRAMEHRIFRYEIEMYEPIIRMFPSRYLVKTEVCFFLKRLDLVFATSGLFRLYAVEAKLRDWRTAFRQALINQIAVHCSYIALPHLLAGRLLDGEKEQFLEHSIGLIGVSHTATIVIPSVKHSCFNKQRFQMLKSEYRCRINDDK